jgi:hypothetical protein
VLRPAPSLVSSRSDEPFLDQLIEEPGSIERNDSGDGPTVVGYGDLAALTDLADVTTQVVSQLTDSDVRHGAPSDVVIIDGIL